MLQQDFVFKIARLIRSRTSVVAVFRRVSHLCGSIVVASNSRQSSVVSRRCRQLAGSFDHLTILTALSFFPTSPSSIMMSSTALRTLLKKVQIKAFNGHSPSTRSTRSKHLKFVPYQVAVTPKSVFFMVSSFGAPSIKSYHSKHQTVALIP